MASGMEADTDAVASRSDGRFNSGWGVLKNQASSGRDAQHAQQHFIGLWMRFSLTHVLGRNHDSWARDSGRREAGKRRSPGRRGHDGFPRVRDGAVELRGALDWLQQSHRLDLKIRNTGCFAFRREVARNRCHQVDIPAGGRHPNHVIRTHLFFPRPAAECAFDHRLRIHKDAVQIKGHVIVVFDPNFGRGFFRGISQPLGEPAMVPCCLILHGPIPVQPSDACWRDMLFLSHGTPRRSTRPRTRQ
ncbi:hypothetical protein SAMN05518854_11530 [Variovorax sp. YR266]|nr:hypothetical protein SAMN05518854_11530 [Variovorax sp. YR266]